MDTAPPAPRRRHGPGQPWLALIRFQPWIVGSAAGLIGLVTLVLASVVWWHSNELADDNARERFDHVAQRVTGEFRARLDVGLELAQTLGAVDARLLRDRDGRVSGDLLLPAWAAALDLHPHLYGLYYGLDNGDFLQTVAVRGDPRIVAALRAPAGTHRAVRTLRPAARTARTEHWRFFDRAGGVLGEREQPSSYHPTERSWYREAQAQQGPVLGAAYTFASTQAPGLTTAAPLAGGGGVFGVDLTLTSLQAFLDASALSDNGAVAVLDDQGRALGASGRGPGHGLALSPLAVLRDVPLPLWQAAARTAAALGNDRVARVSLGGEAHVMVQHTVEPLPGARFQVLVFAPLSDFTASAIDTRNRMLGSTLAVLLVLLPLAWFGTRGVTRALRVLADNSERIQRIDFSTAPQPVRSHLYEVGLLGDAQQTMFASLKQRTEALELAQGKLQRLVDTGIELGRVRDRDTLLRNALFGARSLAHCQAATLLLREGEHLRFALRTSNDPLPELRLPLHGPDGQPQHRFVATHVALTGETVVIDDIYRETRFDVSGTKRFSDASGLRVVSLLCVPIRPRGGEVIGVLQLMNAQDGRGAAVPFDPEIVGFVEAVAAQAAVAIENQNLLDAQKALLDATIQMIAGAIDAKSAHTGGHCERVPELALMLAEQACAVSEGPLADFRFQTEDEWREFRIGAWLHDCGKVTTPEYVVDKATKLETLYNRIHEVRTRFEVLLRDAQIERLQAIHERGEAVADADARFAARQATLRDDFAFVAECNLGGEFMAPERVERLQRIAQQTWWRHFDDRLGLGQEELARHERTAAAPLPAPEALLADRPHHVVERPPTAALDPKYGFRLQVPEYLYHHGELHNLAVGRGTLTEEERFKIQEHIVQTIVMLENMPLPPSLRRVPEYAGTHHETLTGSGYPRRLAAEQLSVPSRIMAIADIFEALTASDRPYKKAKTLSEAIQILSFFKKDRHIDPVLFDLFLTSGVYRAYAERFLRPEQIDAVDIDRYLG
ncbi:HD domain-containing phosphohydrolase [Aquabacterium sp. A08]|uniref:HD domain-containing phosphohydrolase n=1 Tax=Aquabacterium sp. A08 TaxID=2718532 RepID=UPI001FBA20B0|nr:HD domain-containing phosphohydrolase [Aquabacterium sp. A08]